MRRPALAIAAIGIAACGSSSEPKFTISDQSAAGVYQLGTADGKPLPLFVGVVSRGAGSPADSQTLLSARYTIRYNDAASHDAWIVRSYRSRLFRNGLWEAPTTVRDSLYGEYLALDGTLVLVNITEDLGPNVIPRYVLLFNDSLRFSSATTFRIVRGGAAWIFSK